LRALDINLTAYSVAPCWDDEQPYYGLFVEEADLPASDARLKLLQGVEQRLQRINIEYAAKRESQRLGPLRLVLLAKNAWQDWDRTRLAQSGGTLEQYKHPCLIVDPGFRQSVQIKGEVESS
jgi:hypothetical protein